MSVPNVGLGLLPGHVTEKGHLMLRGRCARPREPISSHQHATEGTDWWLSRGRADDVFSTLFASIVCLLHGVSCCLRQISLFTILYHKLPSPS